MATSFDEINQIFYNLIEEDSGFFNYYGLEVAEAEQLAEQRADAYLREAAVKLSLKIQADISFSSFDKTLRIFTEDFTEEEKYLLASLQYEQYLLRDIAKLRAYATRFTSAEQSVFSHANERRTFIEMYERLVQHNEELIDRYSARDRLTGAPKTLDYTSDE